MSPSLIESIRSISFPPRDAAARLATHSDNHDSHNVSVGVQCSQQFHFEAFHTHTHTHTYTLEVI